MRLLLFRYAFLLLIPNLFFAQEYGLQFYAHEKKFNERTFLALNPEGNFKLKNGFDIKFDLSLDQNKEIQFGYILRIITSQNSNVDLVYDPVLSSLNLIEGNSEKMASIPITLSQLSNWTEVSIKFLKEENKFILFAAGKSKTIETELFKDKSKWKFYFGLNHTKYFMTSDLPSMRLKDIRLYDDSELIHKWLLNNKSGTKVKDEVGSITATVENPLWLYALHENWELEKELYFPSYVQVAQKNITDELLFLTKDSLYTFRFSDLGLSKAEKLAKTINLHRGSEIIYNYLSDKIIYYSIDQKEIAQLDLHTLTSDRKIPKTKGLTEFWQHNKFFNPKDSSLVVIGGYGQLKYKNSINYVDIHKNNWAEIDVENSIFKPRYLSSLGVTSNKDTLYVLGGYGSLSGNQSFNPSYIYDLVRILPNEKKIEKVYEFENQQIDNFCFSNSMVIDNDSGEFYALSYSKFEYKNKIQLIKGSLYSPKLITDYKSFPFIFNDIMSYVDLIYSPKQNKLYAITLFYNDHGISKVKVHSLLFPPAVHFIEKESSNSKNIAIYIIIAIFILLIGVIIIIRKNKTSINDDAVVKESKGINTDDKHIIKEESKGINTDDKHVIKEESKGINTDDKHIIKEEYNESILLNNKLLNTDTEDLSYSIIFFGGFQIINKKGIDITKKFTPLLKELFLLIFLYSNESNSLGISSSKLKEILWYDKTDREAGNNRSVNLIRIKKILKELEGITVSKTTGYWKIECEKVIKTDYTCFLDIIHLKKYNEQDIIRLLEITNKGTFLHNLSYEWLDPYKARISNQIIDFFTYYIENKERIIEPHLLINIADVLFSYDSVNEEALIAKCIALSVLGKHSLSKNTYDVFSKEYKLLYGENYSKEYNQIVDVLS